MRFFTRSTSRARLSEATRDSRSFIFSNCLVLDICATDFFAGSSSRRLAGSSAIASPLAVALIIRCPGLGAAGSRSNSCLTPDAGRGRLPQVALIRLRCSAHAAATRVPCLPGGAAQPLLCNVVRTLPGVLLHARAPAIADELQALRGSVGATRTKLKRQRKPRCLHAVCFYEPAAPGMGTAVGFCSSQKKASSHERSAASHSIARSELQIRLAQQRL